VKAIVSIANT